MRFHLFICLFVLTGLRLFAQSGTLVTEGKPATASTYEGAFAPSNTNDGDINTRWASEWNENEWWQVDLAEPMSISSVVIQWEGAYATAYEIQISDDPAFITYEVIATVTNSDGGEDIVTTNSTPQGQYLRMQGVTRALEAYGYSIFEFKAYHSESNPNSEIEVYLHIPFNAQYYSLGITPEDNTGQSTFIAQNEAIDATLYYDAGTTISLSNINITGDYDIRFNTQDETGNPVSSTADPFVTDIYDGMSINIEYVPHEEGGANKLPVADAGVDQIIYTPENSIQLDGSNSYDPDGFIFEHLWSQINGPSTAILSDPDSPQTFANDLTLGTYNFELKVTDDLGAIHTDRVNVTVTEPESSDFSLISPADGALITNSRTPVLEWESLPAATNYEIFLNITRDDYDWYASGNLLDRYTKIGESTTNSFTVPDNLVDRWTYKWYVIANTSEGIKKSNTMQFGLYLPYLENVNDGVSIVDGSRDMNKNGTIEPFENWKLTPEERLDDIMSRLTLEEKASQLFYGGNENPLDGFAFSYGVESGITDNQLSAAQSRMGIPIAFMGDKIHGWKTIFPTQLGLAATRDMDLIYQCGNLQRKEHKNFGFTGTLGPLAEVNTKVLYPRFQEGCGENASEAAANVRAMVCGMQGGPEINPSSMLVTVKHWPSQGAGGESQLQYDEVTIEYHMKPWHAAVEANAASVMPGYNTAPYLDPDFGANSSKKVIDYLRREINFEGFVVTDWLASNTDQSIESLGAGIDVMGGAPSSGTNLTELAAALGESRLNEAVRRVLDVKIRMGLFENPYGDPSAQYNAADHRNIVVDAAKKSFTLLSNNGVLPLQINSGQKIVVSGPRATWDGQNNDPNVIWQSIYYDDPQANTYFEAIQARAEGMNVVLHDGTNAEVAVVVIGENSYTHGTDWADKNPEIPADQMQVIRDYKSQNIPVVVGVILPRPYILTPVISEADAVVALYRPGTGAGEAFAQLLFGDYQPSGKLPFQLPKSQTQLGTDNLNDIVEKWELPYDLGATDEERQQIRNYIANDQKVPTNFGDPLFPYGFGFSGFSFEDDTPPTAFNLLNPADNSDLQLGQTYLEWQSSEDPETNIHHYEVWLNGALFDEVNGPGYALPQSLEEGSYTWHVVAENWAGGRTQSNQTFTFNLEDTEGPLPFNLLSPKNGESVSGTTIPLKWEQTSDQGSGLSHYALYIDNGYIRDFDPVEAIAPSNIALNATATASSSENVDVNGTAAIDGDETTRWSSEHSEDQNITIDLQVVKNISAIEIIWEAAYADEYILQFSSDGNVWNDVITETNGSPGSVIYDKIGQSARYVRMQGVMRGTQYGYSIYEFRIFGTGGFVYDASLAEGEHTWSVEAIDNNGNATIAANAPSNFTAFQDGTNLPPYADAGENQLVRLPQTTTTLDASASYDPEGESLLFSWAQLSGPSNAVFSDLNVASPEISALEGGTYVFEVSVSDGVSTRLSQVEIDVFLATGSSRTVNSDDVQIWPNPAEHFLIVTGHSNNRITGYAVYDANGKVFESKSFGAREKVVIDCSGYNTGLYFLKLKCRDSSPVRSFIKR